MEAAIEAFAKRIRELREEEVRNLCISQYRELKDREAALRSIRESDTDMARSYQEKLEEIQSLRAENRALLEKYNHVCEQNEWLRNHVFGQRGEKMSSIAAASGSMNEDPISEEQVPEESSGAGGKKTLAGSGSTDPDRQARAAAGKKIKEALGPTDAKTMPTKKDTSRLPHTDTFLLDTAKLDELFGKENWEIAGWHKKELLHRPPVTAYVEVRHTAVIKDRESGKLLSMPMEDVFYKRSCATSSFVAYVIYEKVFKSVPFYRQSEDLMNMGLTIPRQDLSNWFEHFCDEYFRTPYYYMQKLQCSRHYAQSDETPLLVLHEEGRDTRTKSYVWVHTTGELDDTHPIVIYSYEPTRGTDHIRHYYAGFTGALTSDAYTSYDALAKESSGRIIACGCLMHARRRFAEALKLVGLDHLSAQQIDALPEYRILLKFGEIYTLETALKQASPEERLAARKKDGVKLVDELYDLIGSVDTDDPLVSEKLRDAVSYSLNHKEELCRFLTDGRIPCDNGFCERSIRILARGRRAWLFSNTAQGADAMTIAYSMVETAVLNRANPLVYLKYLLETVPKYMNLPSGNDQLEELMPWSEAYLRYEKAQLREALNSVMPPPQKKPHYRPYLKKEEPGTGLLQAVS